MSAQKNITTEESGIIWDEIQKAKKILMHCHPNPDGDSIGSTLATAHALRNINKDVTVIQGDSELPLYLSQIPGYDTILRKNFFEINVSEYDLFLILDSGSLNQISKLGEITLPEGLKTIVIDHHRSNEGFADINLVDITYPATAQIMYDLFKRWEVEITKDIALCLFMGMYTDTGGFKYRPTTSKTLAAAADLAAIAPDFPDLIFSIENSNTEGRIIAEGIFLTSIETFFDHTVAIASASYDELKAHNISEKDGTGLDIANLLKSVVGWNIGISLNELEKGIVRISFRTRDPKKYDVSKLAVLLNGGGHSGASGAQIKGSIEEAKKQVLEAIKKAYPDLPQ